MSDYFNATGAPQNKSGGTSATIRAEFKAIQDAFDKMPTLTGNNGKFAIVNSTGTAMVLSSVLSEAAGVLSAASGLDSVSPTIATSSVTTVQLASGRKFQGMYFIRAQGVNIDHKITAIVSADQFGIAQVSILGQEAFVNTLVLGNLRVVGDPTGIARYLVVDTLTALALTITCGAIGGTTGVAVSATPGGSTTISNIVGTVMDIAGNLGVGTTSPLNKLQVRPFTNVNFGVARGVVDVNAALVNSFTDAGAAVGMEFQATQFIWQVSGVEKQRIDFNGNLISVLNSAAPALAINGQMTATLTSNTNLRFSARGSDGVTRVANLTLA